MSFKALAAVILTLGAVIRGAKLQARAPDAECARAHIVQIGETCDFISVNQGVSTFQLAFVNSAINAQCTNLIPGQLICLGIVGQDCTAVHEVVSGDNCFDIANSVGIPLNTLLANNPNVNADCTNLVVGEVLCISDVVIKYTDHL